MSGVIDQVTFEMLEDAKEWQEFFANLSPDDQEALALAAEHAPVMGPLPGPQTLAFNSLADVVGYGGKAGGGKSGCIILKVLLQHQRSLVVRFNKDDLSGFLDDLVEKYGTGIGLNRQDKSFYFADRPGHKMDYGGAGKPGEENSWNGNPHDLICFDEADQVSRQKVEHIMSWNRTIVPGQRCQTMLTFNPPDTVQGRWLIEFFKPWLDVSHPHPAKPGELRFFMRDEDGVEIEVPDSRPRRLILDGKLDTVVPQSRTFIPASLEQNPYLANSGYANHLKNRPKAERDRLYLGKFTSGIKDPERQVIPTAWIEEAQARWEPEGDRFPMDAAGVDPARGGASEMVISPRHRLWWAKQTCIPGVDVITGSAGATQIRNVVTDVDPDCIVCIDTIGVGTSVYDFIRDFRKVQPVVSNIQKGLPMIDEQLKFWNLRAVLWWFFRMIIDPSAGLLPALPRDSALKNDLSAPRYDKKGNKIIIEDKKEVAKRLDRSPDKGDAAVYGVYPLVYGKESLVDRIRPRFKREQRRRDHTGVRDMVVAVPASSQGRSRRLGWMSR